MCALESGSKRDMIDKELSAEECHSNHRENLYFQTYIMDEASTAHVCIDHFPKISLSCSAHNCKKI